MNDDRKSTEAERREEKRQRRAEEEATPAARARRQTFRNGAVAVVLVVLGAAAVSLLLNGYVIQTNPRTVRLWGVAIEGGLTASAVLAAWHVARERRTAAIGLATAVVVIVGATGLIDLRWLTASPIGWAVIITLAIRLVKPVPAEQPDRT